MEDIEIHIDSTVRNLRAVALWKLFHSKLYYGYCLSIFIMGSIIMMKMENSDYASVVFIMLFLCVLPVVGALGMARYAWKQIEIKGKRILRLEKKGVRWIDDRSETFHKWYGIIELKDTGKYLIAMADKHPLFVLCKNRVNPETLGNVKIFIEKIIGEQKAIHH